MRVSLLLGISAPSGGSGHCLGTSPAIADGQGPEEALGDRPDAGIQLATIEKPAGFLPRQARANHADIPSCTKISDFALHRAMTTSEAPIASAHFG